MRNPKNWTEWKEFVASASRKDLREMCLKLVLGQAERHGTIRALEFILKTERDSKSRLFRRLVNVCKENESLGGKRGKKAMADYVARD